MVDVKEHPHRQTLRVPKAKIPQRRRYRNSLDADVPTAGGAHRNWHVRGRLDVPVLALVPGPAVIRERAGTFALCGERILDKVTSPAVAVFEETLPVQLFLLLFHAWYCAVRRQSSNAMGS